MGLSVNNDVNSSYFTNLNDVNDVLSYLEDFKNSLSAPEQALYKDLFDDFAQHFGGNRFVKVGGRPSGIRLPNLAKSQTADEMLSLFKGLREIPDLFQGRIPKGLDTIGTLEHIKKNLSPKYEAFAGTIDELISGLKTSKIEGTELDSELADLISLMGNAGKPDADPRFGILEPAVIPPEITNGTVPPGGVNGQGAEGASSGGTMNNGGVNGAETQESTGAAGGAAGGAEGIGQIVAKQQEENFRRSSGARKGGNNPDSGTDSASLDGARGGSVFEAIALALGEAMNNKLKGLLEAAEGVRSSDEDILQKSAQVTARGQELNAISQAFNSSINSVGQAASTAGRKS